MSIRFAALGLALLPVCALGAPASPSSIPANISVDQLGHLAARRAKSTSPAAAGSIFGNSTSTGGENIGGPISTVQKVQTLTICLPAGTQNVPAGSLGGYRLSCSAATPGGTPTVAMCVDSAPASCTTLSTATLPPSSNAGGALAGTLQDGVKVKMLWKSTGGSDYVLGGTLTQALAIDPETMASQGQKAIVASTADSGYALTTAVPPVDTNTGKVMVGAPPASSSTVAANETVGESFSKTAQTCMGKQSVAIQGGNPVYTCDGSQSLQAQLNSSSGGCPKGSTNCYDLSTDGQQNQPHGAPDTDAMNKALQAHGMLLAIKKGLSGTNPPAVFGGTDGQCERDVAYFTDCCSLSLKKTGSGFQKCSDEEVKLAAAKRAGLAYHIADHCCVSVLGVCTDNKSNYCVFDSMLALIIQEQGRAQLAQMAAAGAAKEASVNETFAPFAGSGHWLPFTVNGNDVWAWQWPAACADPATASTVVNDGDCPATPGQIQWAACSAGSGCTAPTTPPPALPSSTGVSFLATDDGVPWSSAITRTAIITPDPGCPQTPGASCTFQITGLTPGGAMQNTEVSWPLYGPVTGGQWTQAATLPNDWQIAGYTRDMTGSPVLDPSAPSPTSVAIEYGKTGGSMTSVSLPLNVPISGSVNLGASGIKIYGHCSGPYWQCDYHAWEGAPVTPKPWNDPGCKAPGSTPNYPDCTGFSINQFEQLDLSKMDLSQWLKSVTPAEPSASAQKAAAQNAADAIKANAAAQDGTPP